MSKFADIAAKYERSKAEAEQEITEREEAVKAEQERAVVLPSEEKSITDIAMSDIKVKLDGEKSYDEQAKDVVYMAATVAAASDKTTAEALKQSKAEELKEESKNKAAHAKAGRIEGETDVQKKKRELYEEMLELFGVDRHLPEWLMKIVVVLFTPFYIILLLAIGVPTGFIKFLIDCIDKIFVRYEEVGKERKPQVKVITWVLLAVLILGVAAIITLKCLNII